MAFFIAFFVILQFSIASSTEININCGADSPFTTYDNIEFLNDALYDKSIGYGYNYIEDPLKLDTIQIINLGDYLHADQLYRSSIYGVDEYKIDLENGKYLLALFMYEPVYQESERRVFSVEAEEVTIVEDLDIAKEFGAGKVVQLRKLVEVNDGTLNIDFDVFKGRSILTAIRCLSAKEFETLNAPDVELVNGFGQNIMHFPNYDYRIAYYNVYKKIDGNFIKVNSNVFSQTFIDNDINSDKSVYKFSVTDYWGREGSLTDEYEINNLSQYETQISSLHLQADGKDISRIIDNKYENEYVACSVSDKVNQLDAHLRIRGKSTRVFPKKSWKIKFDDDNKYEGKEKLNFVSLVFDPTMIREKLFHDIISESIGFDLKYEYKNLFLNDNYLGLYLSKEQEDNEFLSQYGIDTAAVFKGIGNSSEPLDSLEAYEEAFEIQNNYSGGYSQMHEFFTYVDTASIEELDKNLADRFYVIDYIKTRAIINYLSDIDQCRQNYILIYETDNKKWRYLTYDNNFALMNKNHHIYSYTEKFPDMWGCRVYIFDKVLKVPKYKYLYQSFVKQLYGDYCSPDNINIKIDNLADYIAYDAQRDANKHSHANNVALEVEKKTLKKFFVDREEIAKIQLAEIEQVEAPDGISINEVMTNNVSAVETEKGNYQSWIEFYNDSDVDIDLSDFTLLIKQNGQNYKFNFAVNSVVKPYGYRVFIFDSDNNDSQKYINFDIKNSPAKLLLSRIFNHSETLVDSIDLPSMDADYSFAELDNTSEKWMIFSHSTYNSTNVGMDKYTKIYINEFMAKNNSTLADEDGEYDDWIELYNPNNYEIDLSGYYLSDEIDEIDKWRIPNGVTIDANSFLLFWADKDKKQGHMHADFKLSGDSGYVVLSNSYDIIVDSVYYIDADTDESFARNGDGVPEWIKAHVPTPNRSNIYYDETTKYNLKGIYPNPADDLINVYFVLHRNKYVKIRICDARGLTIKELFNGKHKAGEYQVEYDVTDLSSGAYFLYFETKDYYEVKPFVVVR